MIEFRWVYDCDSSAVIKRIKRAGLRRSTRCILPIAQLTHLQIQTSKQQTGFYSSFLTKYLWHLPSGQDANVFSMCHSMANKCAGKPIIYSNEINSGFAPEIKKIKLKMNLYRTYWKWIVLSSRWWSCKMQDFLGPAIYAKKSEIFRFIIALILLFSSRVPSRRHNEFFFCLLSDQCSQ